MKPVRVHPRVQRDVTEAASHYQSIYGKFAEDFWVELSDSFKRIGKNPEAHHFDASGKRRCNLKRFPYNILFVVLSDRIRIGVVRHNSRNPAFGTNRKNF